MAAAAPSPTPAALDGHSPRLRLRLRRHCFRFRRLQFPSIHCTPKTTTTTTTEEEYFTAAVNPIFSDPPPILRSATTFAPATVANLGPGFDFLGCAVDGLGDRVTAAVDLSIPPGTLRITNIIGSKKLSRSPLHNCAGIAGIAAMKMLGVRSVGVAIDLEKGLPLGSGLGSSAASAAAAAAAVNALFDSKLSPVDLVLASLESERKVSGYHADNVGPAILGGFVLIRSYEPSLDLVHLEFPSDKDLIFVLVSPEFEAPTKKMREALPGHVSMKEHVQNSSQAAALAAAVVQGNARALGAAMSADGIVEPRRAPLIPGMGAVKRAALEAGAFGCTISGAGPTAVAVVDNKEKGKEIADAMVEAFLIDGGLKASATVTVLDRVGARVVSKIAD